jgi:ribosomal protein S18 acetylase RimI-like enzyme
MRPRRALDRRTRTVSAGRAMSDSPCVLPGSPVRRPGGAARTPTGGAAPSLRRGTEAHPDPGRGAVPDPRLPQNGGMGIRIVAVRPGAPPAVVLEQLGEIVVRAYDEVGALEGDDEYVPELRDVARRVREAVVFAALDEADGTPLGCVTYVPGPDNAWAEHLRAGEASIRMLAVDPAAQRRGVGTALVEACLVRARADGRRAVFLHSLPVMTGAQRVYDRLGFRRVPERDWVFPDFLLLGFVLDLA